MSGRQETVREVCAEIEKIATDIGDMCGADVSFEDICWSGSRSRLMFEITDRILSAYEREMAAKDARIALLERAMKPVMKIKKQPVLGLLYKAKCAEAVLEAQRVMREGCAK